MAQHDMNIANQGFPATRADINNALQAIASNNSGTSAPSTTFANQWFYDTTNNKLFIRNEANNAYIQVAVLDQTNNEWQITTGQISASDGDGLVFKTDDGTTRITLSDGGDVTFAAGTDIRTATAGTDCVRIGENAGDSIASGAANNVIIGKDAGTNISTGTNNVVIGHDCGDAITDGNTNVAIGTNALGSNQRGDRNVAVGHNALADANPTSNSGDVDTYNTAIGYLAGTNISTGVQNTIVGGEAGDALVTGSQNTIIGYNAGGATTGVYNSFLGRSSGSAMSNGSKNTIIGSYSGNQHGLDITTTDNNIVLSDGDGNPRGYYHGGVSSPLWQFNSPTTNQWAMRVEATASSSPFGMQILFRNNAPDNNATQFLVCKDSSTTRMLVTNKGNLQNHDNSYGAISDVKLKEQIEDASSQWQDIKDLTIRKYKMKTDIADKGDSNELWRLGVVAQEVETAGMSGLVYETSDMDDDNKDLGTTTKAVKYSILYMKAVKALQEAMARIETLETKVAALEG